MGIDLRDLLDQNVAKQNVIDYNLTLYWETTFSIAQGGNCLTFSNKIVDKSDD